MLTGLNGWQETLSARGSHPSRFDAFSAPRPLGHAGSAGRAFDEVELSVKTDTSAVREPDVGGATDKSVAAAVGSALEQVDYLSRFAKALGDNPDHKPIATFTFDRSGKILSKASLDEDGDLGVYGSGSWGGAKSAINLFVPSTDTDSDNWYAQASSGLALAAYTLNSVLGQVLSDSRGANVDASA